LTACPLYVGPGDNLRRLANPSSNILPRWDPEDCARYMERVRAADKTSKDPPEVGPHESVSQVGSEEDSVETEITKGSSTLTVSDADNPGGKSRCGCRSTRQSHMLTTATSETTNHVEPDGRMLWNDCSRGLYGCPRCAAMIAAKNHAGTKGGNSPKNVCIALWTCGFPVNFILKHLIGVESHTNMHLHSHRICGRRLLLRLSDSRSQVASLSSHRPR
jgi:hypothetical protein